MIIELTLLNGNPITLHLTGNFAVTPDPKDETGSRILDGLQPNASWRVKESYAEVTELVIMRMR
jgi:hypothetical protein